ncbi:hypothetical protein HS088_TW21G01229 [Tripterygium wilfordii]|uniref:DUF7876 domain-containing protein n=1 Tax=Tripterygium wilfordii TaxID=458696 RepID=A0A7J7C4N1_TRIWF|nr:hypothetical protein HS088_TW21G01229 [Tripterygium wilfordii]
MLTTYPLGAITNCIANLGRNVIFDASTCKINHVSSLPSSAIFQCFSGSSSNNVTHNSSFPSKGRDQLNTHHIIHRVASNRWLCRSHDSISPDDEYRSSRNIAISLYRRYRNVIDRGGGDNLKDFISAGVNAYSLGCTDEGLRQELTAMKDSGVEIEAMKNYGGNTGLKLKIFSGEVDECILWLSIIFITILCTPQPTIVRWSSTPPVSDEVRIQWKGFCALIANAYYVRGMAWYVYYFQLHQSFEKMSPSI